MIAKGVFTAGKNALLPNDTRAHEIMHQLKPGDRVLMTVHRARNPEHNALAHVVFQRIADAIGKPMEVVKLWLKWETGRVDLVELPTGKHIPNPRSFKFESMGQDEFQAFWDEAWPIIAEKVLPNLPRETFEELRAIVAREAA